MVVGVRMALKKGCYNRQMKEVVRGMISLIHHTGLCYKHNLALSVSV